MKTNETTTEKIARLLSAITEHDIKIECDFTRKSENCYTSNNLVKHLNVGLVGMQLFEELVLEYKVVAKLDKLIFRPTYKYYHNDGEHNKIKEYQFFFSPRHKQYVFDTEKDEFIFGEDKKQAEQEIDAWEQENLYN